MRILRWVLIVWSVLGGAGAAFLFVVFLDVFDTAVVEVSATLVFRHNRIFAKLDRM